MPSARANEIAEYSKSKGESKDKPKEEEESDTDAVKKSAAKDLAKALGVDAKSVDFEALALALSDFHEACG